MVMTVTVSKIVYVNTPEVLSNDSIFPTGLQPNS